MAQDQWTLQEKEESKTGARAATAGPCCSCQQDSLAACKLLVRSWRTWNEQGKQQNELSKANLNGGKMMRAVGMAGKG